MEKKISVLVLFQFSEHEYLLKRLRDNLDNKNISISLFNSRTLSLVDKKYKYWLLKLFVKIPKVRTLIYFLFRDKIILNLSKKHDIIDIHFFSTIYDNLMIKFGEIPIKISFWGSDAYRISENRKEKLESLTNRASMIRFNTKEMYSNMEIYFKDKEKLGYQIFGNNMFGEISQLQISKNEAKIKLGLNPSKISLFIGYNASSGQQHEKILYQLTTLPYDIKSRIELVIPLTYGASYQRKERIISIAKSTDIDLKTFLNELSVEEIVILRQASDIVLNFQVSDAFSASLQEHFYTGSIMLLADWLPYKWLAEKGLYFRTSKIENINKNVIEIINNLEEENTYCGSNKEIIASISSWDEVAESWTKDYRSLI